MSKITNLPKWRPPIHQIPTVTMTTITTIIMMLMATILLISTGAESRTTMVRPSNGAATLIPGQPLHFECSMSGNPNAQFIWYKKQVGRYQNNSYQDLILLDPSTEDGVEIHNERLTLLKPGYDAIADYSCRVLKGESKIETLRGEEATVRVRMLPYIDDFGIETSHTGKSAVATDGERLELTCHVRDDSVPVNITWLRSVKSDSDDQMVPVMELDSQQTMMLLSNSYRPTSSLESVYTHTVPGAVIVEKVDNHTKRLIIQAVGPEHRGYYSCMVDNGVTERAPKTVFIRVKDKIIALWPFLGIIAELFILFTIIHIWETQKAQKALQSSTGLVASPSSGTPTQSTPKRPASGPTGAFENVPLNG